MSIINIRFFQKIFLFFILVISLYSAKNYNIISYSDIFYKKSAVSLLLKKKYDISITSSVSWKKIWKKRFKNPLVDAETLILIKIFF